MDVVLKEEIEKVVILPQLAVTFRVPHGDHVELDGLVYIQIGNAQNHSIKRAIWSDNPNAPPSSPGLKDVSMTQCTGLAKLKELRNIAHAADLKSSGSKLFEEHQTSVKMPRLSRSEIESKRQAQELRDWIDVTLNVDGQDETVQVMRPVLARDNLWILYDERNISTVIKFFRESTFTGKAHKLKHDGDRGISRLKTRKFTGFRVQVTSPKSGSKSFKRAKDLDQAIDFQANPHLADESQGTSNQDQASGADSADVDAAEAYSTPGPDSPIAHKLDAVMDAYIRDNPDTHYGCDGSDEEPQVPHSPLSDRPDDEPYWKSFPELQAVMQANRHYEDSQLHDHGPESSDAEDEQIAEQNAEYGGELGTS